MCPIIGRDVFPRTGTGSESGQNRIAALADVETVPRELVEAGVVIPASERRFPDPIGATRLSDRKQWCRAIRDDDDDTESDSGCLPLEEGWYCESHREVEVGVGPCPRRAAAILIRSLAAKTDKCCTVACCQEQSRNNDGLR